MCSLMYLACMPHAFLARCGDARLLDLRSPSLLVCDFPAGRTVKDREGAVRKDRDVMEKDPRWIYNDYQQGFEQAQKTQKPLLVVLRCVPCMSCWGMDAAILTDKSLQPLLDQFVCVRLINANAIDLERFQFDYDLSFSTMFFNGDGTVYGRYGSWTHQKNPYDSTLTGYRRALEGRARHSQSLPGKQTRPRRQAGCAHAIQDPGGDSVARAEVSA